MTYDKKDPQQPNGQGQPFREATSTQDFQWVSTNPYEVAPLYDVAHTYTVKSKASITRTSAQLLFGNVNAETVPTISGQTYNIKTENWYSPDPAPIDFNATNTDVRSEYQQSGIIHIERVIQARTSVNALAFRGSRASITVASSASVQTTKIELIARP